MVRTLTECGVIEMLCETEGINSKYAMLCANAFFYTNQKGAIVLGNKISLLIPTSTIREKRYDRHMQKIIDLIGGLKDIYEIGIIVDDLRARFPNLPEF